MKSSIPAADKDKIFGSLSAANRAFQKLYPGDSGQRQPVHTVYGGANLFSSDIAEKMGKAALAHLDLYAPNFCVLAKALELLRLQGKVAEAASVAAQAEADLQQRTAFADQSTVAATTAAADLRRPHTEPAPLGRACVLPCDSRPGR